MKQMKMAVFFLVVLSVGVFAIAGCNSSDDDVATQLSTYSEAVQDCTPYLGTSGDFSSWDLGWNSATEYSVFAKIFNPDNGVECIFNPIEALDEYIEMINNVSASWDTDGESTVSSAYGDMTVTVDNTVESVTVPFYGNSVSVDRLITVEGGSGEDAIALNVAFTVDAEEEALVAHYALGDDEQGVYYAQRNTTTGVIEIWSACYAPDTYGDPVDPFYFNFKWKGNPDEGTFAITQFTSATATAATNGWTVLGGGDIAGDMAFLAECQDAPAGKYYVVVDIDEINGDSVFDGTVVAEATTAPDPTTTAVHAYITDGNDACLGYLTTYPDAETEIAWDEFN